EYVSELDSGKLSWSPPHQSEQFWVQNSSRLNENDYELLRRLGRLLVTSSDPLVLAVGAHDVGQYVKHFANGKKVIQDIGTKQRIMELMVHENSDVRYQALLAVQKLMVNAWA
ncbi:H(+)-transporting V1 sector ATPase subunit H, partial [Basidiobolus ranarum]